MRKFIGLLTFLMLSALPAWSAEGELDKVVNALEAPFKAGGERTTIYDMQADFSQESHLASLDRTQHGGGSVMIQFGRPGGDRMPMARFRWDYDRPEKQEIVSNGTTMWVYLPENRQVIQSDLDTNSQRADDPMTFLTGLGNLSRDFLISWASPHQDAEGNYILELRPRRPSPLIARMLVVVAKEAVGGGGIFPILSTNVIDPSGNSTRIHFSNVRVNRGFADKLFRFEVPTGVEVLHPTGQGIGF